MLNMLEYHQKSLNNICRRQILSRLLCLFLFRASGPFVTCVEFGPCTSSLSFYQVFRFILVIYFVFISYCVLFFVFIHVKCHLVVFRNLIVLLIILCVSRNYLFILFFVFKCVSYLKYVVFNYDSYFKMLFCLNVVLCKDLFHVVSLKCHFIKIC